MADLSAQPAPRRGAKEGFYPDPLGSGRARWWDGNAWTMRVGPHVPPGAPRGRPVDPPKRLCRRCGAESETFGDQCLNCGRSYGARPGIIAAIIAASCVAVILLLGGCALLIAAAVEEAGDEIDEHAITKAEYDSVVPGSTEVGVRASFGEPLNEQSEAGGLECIYYAREDGNLLDINDFKFCFRNGVLVSKSAS